MLGDLTGLTDDALGKLEKVLPAIDLDEIYREGEGGWAKFTGLLVQYGFGYGVATTIARKILNQGAKKNLIKKGITKTDRLNVRSFKIYGDGALGSRGAAMRKSYTDRENHFGALIYAPERYREIARQIAASEFQMNTHAIGDSANTWMLKTYKEVLKDTENRRWRIEHAQIISTKDFQDFDNILPSVQPTHATSDMYWAEARIGKERMKGAYAYRNLLNRYGKIALGTDFPVEQVNPFLTFYSATYRKDLNNFPEDGFQMENSLSREQTLRGMTIWAAFSNFEEQEKGSIEVGKFADFVILNQDIMSVDSDKIPKTNVVSTFLNGEKVYSK